MNKWKELQVLQNKINMISNSVIQKENKIKDSFFESLKNYYKHKYRILHLSNSNICLLGLRNELPRPKKKIKISQSEMICCYEQVKNYFFLLRNDYDLLYKFIKSLRKKEEAQIVQLFVHFFFEDISSETNPSLLELIQMLLKKEIELTPYQYIYSFLEEDTFLCKILRQLVKIKDIKDYYLFAFSHFFSDLEKNKAFIQLSLDSSFGRIDTGTTFKIELEVVKSKKINQSMTMSMYKPSSTMTAATPISNNDDLSMRSTMKPSSSFDSETFISNQILDDCITEKKFRVASQRKNEPEVMKQFYLKCIQKMKNYPNLFSSEHLKKLFKEIDSEDLENYNNNIKTIVCWVSKIVQIFADNPSVPETIRLISIYIAEELKRQYKDINQLYILSHVGKFFIDVLLIPILLQPELNGFLMHNAFLSIPTRQTLTVISPILSKLFTFELFDCSSDILYIPFNSYMISLMPLVMEFLNTMISPPKLTPFNHSLTKGNYQAFCIGIPEIIILLDKVKILFPTEELIKPFRDLPNVKSLLEEQTVSERIDEHYLFLSEGLSPVILEKFKIPQIKAKLISYPPDSGKDYIPEIVCAIANVFRLMPYSLSEDPISTKDLFQIIHQKTMFFTNKNAFEKSTNIPLSWYTTYIQEHLPDIPEEDSKDDYQGLYDKIYNEVKAISDSLTNKKSILSYELSNELHFVQKQANEILEEKKEMKKLSLNIIIESLINTLSIEICFMSGLDLLNFEKQTHFQMPNNYDANGLFLFILNQSKCIHQISEEVLSVGLDMINSSSKQKEKCHFNTIRGFISKFKKCCFFLDDTFSDMSSTSTEGAKSILDKYMEQVRVGISTSQMIRHYDEKEKEEEYIKLLQDCIQEFILRNSWSVNCISQDLKSADFRFVSYCKRYQWIHPVEHLKIPEECLSKSNFELACSFLKKLDYAKTPNEITTLFQKTADVLNKSLAFTSCKTEVGADDLNPIYIYLVIKVKPQRMVSQFNYCKLFLGQTNLLGKIGYLVTTIELIIQCISNLNHSTLNISLEDFNQKCSQSETAP